MYWYSFSLHFNPLKKPQYVDVHNFIHTSAKALTFSYNFCYLEENKMFWPIFRRLHIFFFIVYTHHTQ